MKGLCSDTMLVHYVVCIRDIYHPTILHNILNNNNNNALFQLDFIKFLSTFQNSKTNNFRKLPSDLFPRERAEGIIWGPLTKPSDEDKPYASGPKERFSSVAPLPTENEERGGCR